ncbi:transposase [Ideonella sp. B508-1]|uniref:transposase n=1 Tax=Ideonella sp. B508-1 TaxID=137716 RepID=UPI0011D20460|nr:transposase [Ideonella sp. B508-1]
MISKARPLRVKVSPVAAFTIDAIKHRAQVNLLPGCDMRSDGLNCFAGIIDANYAHADIVVGSCKPRDMPQVSTPCRTAARP